MQQPSKVQCGHVYDLWSGVVMTCRRDRGHAGDHTSYDAFGRSTMRWPRV